MPRSLYERYATPTRAKAVGPGTIETKAIETVDNDVSAVVGHGFGVVGQESSRFTAAVETSDEEGGLMLQALASSHEPGPRPGSALTASVETSDEDAAAALHCLP